MDYITYTKAPLHTILIPNILSLMNTSRHIGDQIKFVKSAFKKFEGLWSA